MKYFGLSRKNILYIILAIIIVISCIFMSKSHKNHSPAILTDTRIALDTVVTISIYDSSDHSILENAFKICNYYENVFSRTNKNSELYVLNHSVQIKTPVSKDLASLIQTGLKYCNLSNGTFDITIAPISSLWDFKANTPVVPNISDINCNLNKINYQNISVSENIVTRTILDNQIDLGAIAKGYIADKLKSYLLENGVNSAIINLGGNILLVGSKPNNSNFNIGIQAPFEKQNKTIASIEISDKSIVTSGIYERYFTQDNKLYHHILNPKTGFPIDNNLMSVTIISPTSTEGDALSTTCFAIGLEKGMDYINSKNNLDAIFITKDGKEHYSKNLFKKYMIKTLS